MPCMDSTALPAPSTIRTYTAQVENSVRLRIETFLSNVARPRRACSAVRYFVVRGQMQKKLHCTFISLFPSTAREEEKGKGAKAFSRHH